MNKKIIKSVFFLLFLVAVSFEIKAQVVLEDEVKITDFGLHFDGSKVASNAPNTGTNAPYDYFFGKSISAHGDCIKTYGNFVFMTWYKGGKGDRHVMLTRYNTSTGTSATIEFPHQHTGYQNKWWIGESHNTIAVAVSPLDGTIHLIYDMHAYSRTKPSNGSLSDDYFRYSYSNKNMASVSDADFTLDEFVKNSDGGYKHLSLNGGEDYDNFAALTYPKFFLNDAGDVFVYVREGGNNNGAYKFSKYDANTSTWSSFTHFNVLNARSQPGITYNWGLYGNMKYVNGKIRVGFQRRSQNNNDKYQYQNGVYYAYSDNQNGFDSWKNHSGTPFSLPLYDADEIKVMEPGDYVTTTQANKVHIVGDFDWTVTAKGDVHIISRVKDNENNVTKRLHTYKPAGAIDFITSEDFAGGTSVYTSGDNVYIIGLTSSKRVFVDKAVGGTNNFTRVYEATSGKTYDHGRVHINNGKLYYYLMENKSGNAQPLYLQIIDLDVVKDPFRVVLTSPLDGEKLDLNETITVNADAVDENGSISKVEFRVNEESIGEVTTAPYTIDWSSHIVGAYTIQAIAYNANNETAFSTKRTVNVRVKSATDLTGEIYRIKNFVTGAYLQSVGSDVVESDTRENVALGDKEWEFVTSGEYYNIESKRSDRGILRAAGNPPNDIINTGFGAPREDSDKQWTVVAENDGTYLFKTRNGEKYLYHNENGIIEHSLNNDDRAKWIVESNALSVDEKEFDSVAVKVYPNPANDKFTIALEGLNDVRVHIYDVLGNLVYKNTIRNSNLELTTRDKFDPGIYIVQVVYNGKYYRTKFVIK